MKSALVLGAVLAASIGIAWGGPTTARGSAPSRMVATPRRSLTTLPSAFQPLRVWTDGSWTVWTDGYSRGRFTVFESADAGQRWQAIPVPAGIPSEAASIRGTMGASAHNGQPQVAVQPGGHIWLAWHDLKQSRMTVALTDNNGRQWARAYTSVADLASIVAQVTFVNPQDGWIVVGGQGFTGSIPYWIYRTTDGGAQWQGTSPKTANEVPFPTYDAADLVFPSARVGWLAFTSTSPGVYLYRTTDAARRWQRVSLAPPPDLLVTTAVAGPSFGAHGRDGLLLVQYQTRAGRAGFAAYQTKNDGITWQRMPGTFPVPRKTVIHGSAVLAGRIAWVWVGSVLAKTTDGGAHWIEAPSPLGPLPSDWLPSMVLVNRTTAWGINQHVQLAITRNGGSVWHAVK